MLETPQDGVCKSCRRPYADRVWAADEYVKQNRTLVRAHGEERARQDWQAMREAYFAGFADCPLN